MKIEILSPGPMEMKDVTMTEAGMKGTPLFYGKGIDGNGAVVRLLKENGEILSWGYLRINGKTGKMSFQDRTRAVSPLIEQAPTAVVAQPTPGSKK